MKLINGVEYKASEVKLILLGEEITGITSISYNDKKPLLGSSLSEYLKERPKTIRIPRKTKKRVCKIIRKYYPEIKIFKGCSAYNKIMIWNQILEELYFR